MKWLWIILMTLIGAGLGLIINLYYLDDISVIWILVGMSLGPLAGIIHEKKIHKPRTIKYARFSFCIVIGVMLGALAGRFTSCTCDGFDAVSFIVCIIISVIVGLIWQIIASRSSRVYDKSLTALPVSAADFITRIIKKMRYRRSVRKEVKQELADHFEDELAEYQTEIKEEKAKILIEEFGDTKMLAVLLRRAKKRCRPLWQKVTIRTIQCIGLLFAIHILMFFTSKPVVTVDYLKEMNKLNRPSVDDSLNARPFYDKAVECYVPMPNDLLVGKNNDIKPKTYSELDVDQYPVLKKWLDDNKQALDFLEQGTNVSHLWYTYTISDPNHGFFGMFAPKLSDHKELARCLLWRAQYSAKKGDFNSAISDILVCYRFGRQFHGSKTIIEQLVSNGIRRMSLTDTRMLLAEYSLDNIILEELHNELYELTSIDDYKFNFEFERFFHYDEIQRMYSAWGLGGGRITFRGYKRFCSNIKLFNKNNDDDLIFYWIQLPYALFLHPGREQSIEMVDEVYNYWRDISNKSPAQINAEGRWKIYSKFHDLARKNKKNIFIGFFMASFSKINEFSYELKTEAEATLAVIALARYKKQFGHYPDSLEQLVDTGLLSELPIDYFSDEPLVYRKTDDSFILYSIGGDFEDDGGVEKKDRDEGDFVFGWTVSPA